MADWLGSGAKSAREVADKIVTEAVRRVKMALRTDALTVGAFGCNGAAAQSSATVGAALTAYAAGANGLAVGADMAALVAKVNALEAALIANGIAVQ